jgi:hypothetical protein
MCVCSLARAVFSILSAKQPGLCLLDDPLSAVGSCASTSCVEFWFLACVCRFGRMKWIAEGLACACVYVNVRNCMCVCVCMHAPDSHVGEHLFSEAIKGALKDHARVLVTHQLQFLPLVDRVIVLGSGGTIMHQVSQLAGGCITDGCVGFVWLSSCETCFCEGDREAIGS